MEIDREYVKVLEAENEALRLKIDTNPILANILGKYFFLSKKVNRQGKEHYSIGLTPMILAKEDYDYLLRIGVPEDFISEFSHGEISGFVFDEYESKKILENYRKTIDVPQEYLDDVFLSKSFHYDLVEGS